ncbi:periplasmic heavy metal sensor [Desulfobacterales bacterium HSG2]|nr:periplasmic heavy metal sensor [Desulfobacterales bacterium HSG2]
MKKISLFAVLAMVLASATFVMAQPGMGRGKMGRGWGMNPSVLSALNLTTEQTESIRSLRESFEKDVAPLRTQKFERKAELKLLWMQTDADSEKIKAKQREIHDLKWQIQEKTTDFRIAFRGILTPEQLSKVLAIGGGWGMKSHRGKGRRGHPGKRMRQDQ